MTRDSGLILRAIPYSDSARILKCFTESQGLISLFARGSKKKGGKGFLSHGSFIEFTADLNRSKEIQTLKDVRWDPRIPTDPLMPEQHALWLFTIELLQRSIKEELPIPQLLHRVRMYYALLTNSDVLQHPLVPLLLISSELGLSDLQQVSRMADDEVVNALSSLGWKAIQDEQVDPIPREQLFHIERDRFQEHFSIDRIESLYLFED